MKSSWFCVEEGEVRITPGERTVEIACLGETESQVEDGDGCMRTEKVTEEIAAHMTPEQAEDLARQLRRAARAVRRAARARGVLTLTPAHDCKAHTSVDPVVCAAGLTLEDTA